MPDPLLSIAATSVLLLMILCGTALLGWRAWLDLRRLEVETRPRMGAGCPPVGSLIELADLRERVRKLERIAEIIDP